MTHRPTKGKDGLFHINGHAYKQVRGSKAQVMHKTAYKTNSGLTFGDLMRGSSGTYVSKKVHMRTKKARSTMKNKTARRWF